MIRVLVVDDSAFMRRVIRQMLESDAEIEVVGVARDGQEGLDFARKLQPDVITMDIEMPSMDGLTALRFVMREAPTQVLMLSSLTTEGSLASLQALKLGAADVLAKDASQFSANITKIQGELLIRVRALGRSRARRAATAKSAPTSPSATAPPPTFRRGQFDLVCIGSSTGGPPVLETLISALPPAFDTPIVIAQHMPELFTRSMAARLDEMCSQRVLHAADGMPIERKTIYIASGGSHTKIVKKSLARHALAVGPEPTDAVYKPSVNALLSSAAAATGSRTLAIVLTGIGDDGMLGAKDLHAKGAIVLAQSEPTCVVYGMPKAVASANLAKACLAPAELGRALASLAGAPAAAA